MDRLVGVEADTYWADRVGVLQAVQLINTQEKNVSDVKVSVLNNGPIKVDGAVDLVLEDAVPMNPAGPIFLCRCGASANKPFCDGAHTRIGFKSSAAQN